MLRVTKMVLIGAIAGLAAGCAVMEVAMVGAGKSATAEDTGFLRSYQGLVASNDPAYPNLPDLSYISSQARVASYKTVVMPDFTSLTTDISKLSGLQIRQYRNIKQELPDQVAATFDGSAFGKVTRTPDRIDPRDTEAMRKLPVDAVLMGNIKELVSLGGEHRAGLTAVQVEYKLVDVRTGEEVVTAIHRATTDLDKIAMAQVRVLTDLLKKAKATAPAAGSLPPASAPAAVPLAAPRSAQDGTERVSAARPMTAKEVQERLISLGYKPGVPDGVMGQRTVNALKAFQRDKGLPQTGTADEQTMLKLQAK